MSGLIPITVNTPPGEEAHIHAEDDASVYLSLFGGDGVSTNGQSCKATVLSNNKVRIADGIICVGGHFARIPYGDYIDCEIDSGQSGKNRNDIIVARIKTTGTGGIDTYTCEVKKGTAGSTATDPEIVQEDLYKAGKVRELPLYRVKIEGLSITAVEQLFTLRKTNEELEKELESLNSKSCELSTITVNSITWTVIKYNDGHFEAYSSCSCYCSQSKLYTSDIALPFEATSIAGAYVNPSYHGFYLSKWYINEPQSYSMSALNLAFVTTAVSSHTDFKFDILVQGKWK